MNSMYEPSLITVSSWTLWLKPSKNRTDRSTHFRLHLAPYRAVSVSASSPSALAMRGPICVLQPGRLLYAARPILP